jgi:hypothetical protein
MIMGSSQQDYDVKQNFAQPLTYCSIPTYDQFLLHILTDRLNMVGDAWSRVYGFRHDPSGLLSRVSGSTHWPERVKIATSPEAVLIFFIYQVLLSFY